MTLMILTFYTFIQAVSCSNITFQGEFLPSAKEQSFVKYFLLSKLIEQDFDIENIPIFPYTPISAVVLDTTPLKTFFPEKFRFEELLEVDITRHFSSRRPLPNKERIRTLELPEEIKIATLFTSEVPFKEDSEWHYFIGSYHHCYSSISTLKEHLELAIPKETLRRYDIKIKNLKYGVWPCFWSKTRPTDANNHFLFDGTVDLKIYLPFNDVIRERFNKDFGKAFAILRTRLSSKEFKDLEERIKCMEEHERPPGFGLSIKRLIQVEQRVGNNGDSQYKLTFIEEDFSEKEKNEPHNLRISFSSFINISHSYYADFGYNVGSDWIPFYMTDGHFINASDNKYQDIESIASLFEKHFGIVSADKNNTDRNSSEENITGENNNHENCSKLKTYGIYVFWFSLVCLVIVILSLAYYYRRKKTKYFNYSKRKQGKDKKLKK